MFDQGARGSAATSSVLPFSVHRGSLPSSRATGAPSSPRSSSSDEIDYGSSDDSDTIEVVHQRSHNGSRNSLVAQVKPFLSVASSSTPSNRGSFASPSSFPQFASTSPHYRRGERARSISSSLNQIHVPITTLRSLRLPLLLGSGLAIFAIFGLMLRSGVGPGSAGSSGISATALDAQRNLRGKLAVDFESHEIPDEWKCNPFKELGSLHVDVQKDVNNAWVPFDEDCEPSTLMKDLLDHLAIKRSRQKSWQKKPFIQEHFPWLINATVILHGDSMDRLHNNDWCEFVGGNKINVDPEHPWSPPIVRKVMPTILGDDGGETQESIEAKAARAQSEDEWGSRRGHNWYQTRPWICDLQEYNATVINVFNWGVLQDMEAVYAGEDFFHSPSTYLERFDHIMIPLLKNVAKGLNRPSVMEPSLIELSAGFWDLRAMTELNFIAVGISRPYPQDSSIPFGSIGKDREQQWSTNMRHALEHRNNYTPYTRAFTLDQLTRKLVHDLRVESVISHPTMFGSMRDHLQQSWKQRHKPHDDEEGEEAQGADSNIDFGFDERLRIDEIGPLLRGQDDQFKDFLHPNPIPGSYLWGDIMMYELKRAVEKVGRTYA
ncbi:BQ2448_7975 [Microbotryum intermedium]|uniref:BQ2448_7975 protein n=1 Tax=Microbotryum intermedium TaxID=269621 RepID=A0A238FV62_9BASI|nr:BQ2448_7975 [Microbotryum intermedium]